MDVGLIRSDLLFGANRRLLAEARALDADLGAGAALEGMLNPREGLLLYLLARRTAHLGSVVEIGAYAGKSTWYLARGVADAGSGERVVSIDPHPGAQLERYRAQLEPMGVLSRVDVRVGLSHDVAREFGRPVGLLWIDGDHAYEAVRQDFEDWFPRVVEGGWVALHDTISGWPGPARLARELLRSRDDLSDVGVVWLTTYARKTAPSRANRRRLLGARAGFEALSLVQSARQSLRARLSAPRASR